MTHREQILEQALTLSPEDRAFVVAALSQSLDSVATQANQTAEELSTELQRRSAVYRAGQSTARPAAVVLAEQRERQEG